MPRGRMLNKRISTDPIFENLSQEATILFTWSLPHLDCEGKIRCNTQILKGVVVPYLPYMTEKVIEKCVKELHESGLVLVYGEHSNYMKFLGFEKNQKINKAKESHSEIPDPTPELLQSCSRVTPHEVKLSKVKLSKVKLSKVNIDNEKGSSSITTPAFNPVKFAAAFFGQKYAEKRGRVYVYNYGKEMKLIKDLLSQITLDEFKGKVEAFFDSKDQFICSTDYSIGVFKAVINKLAAKQAKPEGWRDIYGRDKDGFTN